MNLRHINNRRYLQNLIFYLLFALCSLFPYSNIYAKEISLAQKISKHLSALKSFKTNYGILILAKQNQQFIPIFAKNIAKPLKPASNEKLITTAGALNTLSENFYFNTILGTLNEDLVIIGDGDPGFGDIRISAKSACEIFDNWAKQLIKKGITYIPGNLIFDASIFDNTFRHPNWPKNQFNKWYTAPVAGLNLNDNCLDISVEIKPNGNSQLIINPFTNTITINPIWQTGNSSRTIINVGWNSNTDLILKITLGSKSAGPVSIPVPDPLIFFANICRERFESYGIKIAGKTLFKKIRNPDGSIANNFTRIAQYSTPIFENVKRANKNSQNLFAECIFKRTGFAYARKHSGFAVGSWTSGQYAYSDFLENQLGIPENEFNIDDGSGLSDKNRLSVNTICRVLQFVLSQNWKNKFIDTLAVAGRDGTLTRRMRNTPAANRIRAKTGYISSVSALSGYLIDKGQIKVIFAMIFNDFPRAKLWQIKQIQDRICIELSRYYNNISNRKN